MATVRERRKNRLLSPAVLIAMLSAPAGYAQASPAGPPDGGRLEARVLGDRILVRAELQTETWVKDTHIVIDVARPTALEVNRRVLPSLSWGEGERTLKLVADGFRIEVPRDGVVLETGNLTKGLSGRYGDELGQIDVAAIIGWPVLRDYAMRLNLAVGELVLTPGDEVDIDAVRSAFETVVAGVTVFDDRVLIPINYDGGTAAYMEFDTAGYHTRIDRSPVNTIGEPSSEVKDIYLGISGRAERLSGMAAFFPTDFAAERQAAYEAAKAREDAIREQGGEVPAYMLAKPIAEFGERVLLRTGLSLLSGYDIEINPVRGYAAVTRAVDSRYSDADAEFYAAAAASDMEKLRRYARRYPKDRNVEEAVRRLFDLGLESSAAVAEQMEIVDIGLAVTEERRKMAYVSDFAAPLLAPDVIDGHTDLIIAIGEKAMEFVSRAQKPGNRQRMQLLLGDRYLANGDAHQAWKYFLAAAFNGDPQMDGVTRHELGRAYEALGRHRRAYSNYRRALSKFVVLPPAMAESARAGLERLRPRLDPDDPLLEEGEDGG